MIGDLMFYAELAKPAIGEVPLHLEVVLFSGTEWRLGLRWILGWITPQFLLVCVRSIDLVGRPAAEGRVGRSASVVANPTTDPGLASLPVSKH